MADTTTISEAKRWCEAARKLLGLGIFSADGRALSNRAAKTAESLKQLQKAIASGKIPLSPAMLKHYEHQFIAIAKDTKAAAEEGDKDEFDRQSEFLKELRLELATHRAKDGEERAKAEKAFEEQQSANLTRDQATSGEIEAAYQKEEYEKAREATLPQIKVVAGDSDLAVIGGSAVRSQFSKALGLARQKKWKEARLALEIAYGNAERVEKRKPYIKARRKHEANIKAAMGIKYPKTGETYGEQQKELWDQAQKLADNGAFEEAAAVIGKAADMIKNVIRKDNELDDKRGAVEEDRVANIAEMNTLLESAKPDIEKLRELARKELKDYADQAADLGVDPGAPSRENCKKPKKAEATFKKYDWFALKDKLHDDKDDFDKEQMWDLWRYRQKYVTDLIDRLREKYPSLIAKASGSADLESDIDITFASATPGDDVTAAKEFNQTIISKFSKPAGRVFDVNIYPRDYRAISESFNLDFNPDQIPDHDIDHPGEVEMGKLSQVDQDVATLLKQRRFLDQETFQDLLDKVLKATPDKKVADQIRKQYEEGEDIYLLTSIEKVDAIIATLKKKKKLPVSDKKHPEAAKAYKTFLALRKDADKGGKKEMELMQRLLPDLLDALEAAFEAEVMETTDAMYLDKMEKLREKQTTIAALDNGAAGAEAHHPGKSCEQAHPEEENHEAWCKDRSEALKAQVKKDQFENIIFANEAYMSQGAIEHIVAGIQAKKADPEKAAAAIKSLTPATVLQSVNEQMADFFKDMKHAEHEVAEAAKAAEGGEAKARRATGEAFVHASKYLVRLLDGAQILADQFEKEDPPLRFDLIDKVVKDSSVKTPNDLKGKVEEMLYALRKSAEVPAGVKGEVGVAEVDALFHVSDIKGFRDVIFNFGVDVNAKVRSYDKFIERQNIDRETEKKYFANV